MTRHARYHLPVRTSVAAQIAQMRVAHPSLKLATWRCGEARWVGTLRPSDASVTYAVTVAYRLGERPRVFVTVPSLVRRPEAEIPHRHQDGSLCLHLPDEWDSTMSIAETIVPWATLWLYHYEVWHATGEWLGGGAHPRVRPRLARRVAEAARLREISTAGAA
jgi:hypothetical protein